MSPRSGRAPCAPSSLVPVLACLALAGCLTQQQQQQRTGPPISFWGSGLSGGLGVGQSNVDSSTGDDSNYSVDESGTSLSAFVDYRIHKFFGVEGGYVKFGDEDYDYVFGGETGTVKTDGFHLSALGFYPIYGIFEAMARVGIFRWHSDDADKFGGTTHHFRDDGTDAYFGLGVQAKFTPHWGARLEWARLNADDSVDNLMLSAFFQI